MDKRDLKQLTKVYPNEIVFVLKGNIPPKKNAKDIKTNWKTGKPFITSSDNYKAWEKSAYMQIKTQMQGNIFPIKECDSIVVTLFYGDLRLKDNTNTVEGIHDVLVACGVILDDNWRVTGPTTQIPEYRKGNPGAEISIRLP